jgi:hypothetical protein
VGYWYPNYNGASLQVGDSYAITAMPGSGCEFIYWLSGTNPPLTVLTNGTTLQFVMESNLVLQAYFLDLTPPTIQITEPTSGLQVGNANYLVTGTASDNVAVSNVLYSLNGAGWSQAVTVDNWSDWTAPVTLIPGNNTLQAYAVDTSGNVSPISTVVFDYVPSAILTVATNGDGSISPNYNGQSLPIGSTFNMTAKPAKSFTFTDWTDGLGNVLTNHPRLNLPWRQTSHWLLTFMTPSRPA